MGSMLNFKKGFTLLEVVITMIILGVIAGLAAPTYFRSVEDSRTNEATVTLNAIYMGQKVYALNHGGNYWSPGNNPAMANINTTLNLDLNPQFFGVTSIAANNGVNPKTFTATVQRNTVQGGDGVTQFTINQTGAVA